MSANSKVTEGFRFVYRYGVEKDAQDHAAALRAEGWETWVRVTPRYPKRPPYRNFFEVWRRPALVAKEV